MLLKRRVVERAVSWIMRARRYVRGCGRFPRHGEAHRSWNLITLMTRRLTGPVRKRHPMLPATAGPEPPPVRIRTGPNGIRLAPALLR
ncbi:MAG: hypothetical protein HOZ81_17210 [Streptomyces sp.]|nr:hypothetical protein [Streptomyces sp.]